MNWTAILVLGLVSAPVAAGSAWLARKGDFGWSARQRVFNSAAIVPVIIAAGAACFGLVILAWGGDQRMLGADNFLVQSLIAVFVAFDAGLIAAYLVERAHP